MFRPCLEFHSRAPMRLCCYARSRVELAMEPPYLLGAALHFSNRVECALGLVYLRRSTFMGPTPDPQTLVALDISEVVGGSPTPFLVNNTVGGTPCSQQRSRVGLSLCCFQSVFTRY